jgi:hypothetical protein
MLLLVFPVISIAQTSVKVTEDKAYLYHQPDTNSSLQIVAEKGDIFGVHNTQKNWLQINLFSGSTWYIKTSQAHVVNDIPGYPSDPSTRDKICMQAKKARKEASAKAMADYPNDINKQTIHEKVLFDKYLLETFRNFGIPATHHSKLVECVNDGIFHILKIDS